METFNNELKLKAVAVNSQHGGCNQQVLEVNTQRARFSTRDADLLSENRSGGMAGCHNLTGDVIITSVHTRSIEEPRVRATRTLCHD